MNRSLSLSAANRARQRGMALLSVLVVLAVLLALLGPFLLSMDHLARSASVTVEGVKADLAVASARDAVLARGALLHESVDPTPLSNGLGECDVFFQPPEAFGPLRHEAAAHPHRALVRAEAHDEQRRIHLGSATPLAIGNLLGLSAFTTEDLAPDGDRILCGDLSGFPESGFVVVAGELLHFGRRTATALEELQRGLLSEEEDAAFLEPQAVPAHSAVLDARCRLVVTFPFDEGGNGRIAYTPWRSLEELGRISELGMGPFSREMVERLRPHVTLHSTRHGAGEWMRPERVFNALEAGETRTLVVRNTYLSPGTVVRLRGPGVEEYGMVLKVTPGRPRGTQVRLPVSLEVTLEKPVVFHHPPMETVVEAMAPHPVNANTASQEVLAALMAGLQRRPGVDREGLPRAFPPVSRTKAAEMAASLVERRETPDEGGWVLPFAGFADLVERWFSPMAAENVLAHPELFVLHRNLLTARDSTNAMGTAPVCFHSDSVVRYRAGASVLAPSGLERSRRELQGTAHALPAGLLHRVLVTQEQFEEELRLSRKSPWWTTGPVNVAIAPPSFPGGGGPQPGDRSSAHLLGLLPLDEPSRFPATGHADSFAQLQPAAVRSGLPASLYVSMGDSPHPEGRNLTREGPFEVVDASGAAAGPAEPPGARAEGARGARFSRDRGSFPLGVPGGRGLMGRFAVSFWWRPETLADQTVFDLSPDGRLANRVALRLSEGNLQLLVWDAAGEDPQARPEETAGLFEVPLEVSGLEPDTWFHVNFSADGTRPDQLALFTDGALKGSARGRTYLTQGLPEYRPSGDPLLDMGRHPTIQVEDASGLPEEGVLRIGTELIEYTGRGSGALATERRDSRGGRAARMAMAEFNPARGRADRFGLELDEEALRSLDAAPAHPAGAAVELYGYANPFTPDTVVPLGEGALPSDLGPFQVARVVDESDSIFLSSLNPPLQILVGRGISETRTGAIELGPPVPPGGGAGGGAANVMEAFSPDGGYALLMQRRMRLQIVDGPGGVGLGEVEVGGVEVLRYSGVQGNRLLVADRGGRLAPDLDGAALAWFNERSAQYVSDWGETVWLDRRGRPIPDIETYPQLYTYCVPISIPYSGELPDPSRAGHAEWVQIYPGAGREEDTEWVRYDALLDRHAVRSRAAAVSRLYWALFGEDETMDVDLDRGSQGALRPPWLEAPIRYPQPPRSAVREIGTPDEVEYGDNLPHYAARRALQFRGDPATGTSSHRQGAGSALHPVVRAEIRPGLLAGLGGRLGRGDRVALAVGAEQGGTEELPSEWHTVNWVARRFAGDQAAGAGRPAGRNLAGPPAQLVAFKEGVGLPLMGRAGEDAAARGTNRDSRMMDRILKHPSGELPAVTGSTALVGGGALEGAPAAGGLLAEVVVALRRQPLDPVPASFLLEEELAEGASALRLAGALVRTALGVGLHAGGGRASPGEGGALLLVDGELMVARRSSDEGTVELARDGRGLLGTRRRAHAAGSSVVVLDHVPTTVLSAEMTPSSHEAAVESLAGFPSEGTLLLGGELLHYTWTRGGEEGGGSFEMPRRTATAGEEEEASLDPSRRAGAGLLRGRFGTTPARHTEGTAVVAFPFRYWHRWAERAEDPELAYFTVQLLGPDLWLESVGWEAEETEPLARLGALLRADGVSPWTGRPGPGEGAAPGLLRFQQGTVQGRANPVGIQGNHFEVRFFTDWRSGAFDPVSWRSNAWKRVPRLRAVVLGYRGETRILEERVTVR